MPPERNISFITPRSKVRGLTRYARATPSSLASANLAQRVLGPKTFDARRRNTGNWVGPQRSITRPAGREPLDLRLAEVFLPAVAPKERKWAGRESPRETSWPFAYTFDNRTRFLARLICE